VLLDYFAGLWAFTVLQLNGLWGSHQQASAEMYAEATAR
jgi:hypothetical protein